MPPIPARCANGHVSLVDGLIGVTGDGVARVTFRNTTVGPCPLCGAELRVVDGEYLLTERDTLLLRQLAPTVRSPLIDLLQEFSRPSDDDNDPDDPTTGNAQLVAAIERLADQISASDAVQAGYLRELAESAKSKPTYLLRKWAAGLVAVLLTLAGLAQGTEAALQLRDRMRKDETSTLSSEDGDSDATDGLIRRIAAEVNREAALQSTPDPPSLPKVARNDPCWCGSSQKFKFCHGGSNR